jgi:hypothetical protein
MAAHTVVQLSDDSGDGGNSKPYEDAVFRRAPAQYRSTAYVAAPTPQRASHEMTGFAVEGIRRVRNIHQASTDAKRDP